MFDSKFVFEGRVAPSGEWRPVIYDPTQSAEAAALEALLGDDPGIQVFDRLDAQIRDLVKIRHPARRLADEDLAELVGAYLDPRPAREVGVWVFYPWSRRLVHVLPEAEFVELRLSRNKFKITAEQQRILAMRRVGVVGLSVGQSVALAMSLERTFGEIRLADFDTLDLSNLNRLRGGVHSIGVPKVHLAAREIFEIDPFLRVTCLPEGLLEENLEAFFFRGGPLDVVIDECDDLAMKVRVRQFARQNRVPVVMDTSDRGLVDVERFDLEPARPILHGLAEGLDPARLRGLSNEEKVPHVLQIAGIDSMSPALKASLLEIEQTIVTWPQLGSEGMLGGAVVADVVRRIHLGQPAPSGRYHIDVAALTGAGEPEVTEAEAIPALVDEVSPFVAIARQRATKGFAGGEDLRPDVLERLVQAAITAPSGANCQPWAWVYRRPTISLFHHARSYSLTDFLGLGGVAALGAATENLVLAAHRERLEVSLRPFPSERHPELVAEIELHGGCGPSESHAHDELAAFIELRHTNRRTGPRRRIESGGLDALVSAVRSVRGADLQLLETDAELAEIGRLVGAADRLRFLDETLHAEMMREIRWTPEEAAQTRDGLFVGDLELSPTERAGLEVCKNGTALRMVRAWGGGAALEKAGRRSIEASSAVGLITMRGASALDYFRGGRAMQRAWLRATQLGIALHPQSALPYFFARLLRGGGEGFSGSMIDSLRGLRERYHRLFSVADDMAEVVLFKLSRAEAPAGRAWRRPVEQVLQIV